MIKFRNSLVNIQQGKLKIEAIPELSMPLMQEISQAYERICTAQYLMQEYEVDEEQAWPKACIIRDKMAENPRLTEEEAIGGIKHELRRI